MAKKSKRKQFSPHIYAEWGELFEYLTNEQKAEILMAITKFPNYEPKDVQIWGFIKSQLQKDYEDFIEKCEKNGEISRNYWANKNKSKDIQQNANDVESISNDNRTITNDTERHPKLITETETNNDLQKQKKEFKKLGEFQHFLIV